MNCFIRENGSTPVTSPGFERNDDSFAAEFAAHLQLPFKNHKHRSRRDRPGAEIACLPP